MNATTDALGSRLNSLHTSYEIVDFVLNTVHEDLSEDAIEYLKIFLMDTLAVGVGGLCSPGADIVFKSCQSWGDGDAARIIGRPGETLSAVNAAYVNGYQIHALEWDGLHEHSVVICMCVSVAALMAEAEQRPVSGKDFTLALTIAVQVAVLMGEGSETAPRFFRPAVAGLMGAAMGIAKLRGYDRETTLQTLGLAYSQASGTMQAHWEGEMMLAVQVGINARAAICAADLAEAGAQSPVDVILGKFGFFTLFETADNIDASIKALTERWAITEMAHKPFPAGRATQSVLTMFVELFSEYDIPRDNIEKIIVRVPPLIMFLVGRPLTDTMSASYSRLCLKVIGPMMLLDGEIDPRKFPNKSAPSKEVRQLAELFEIVLNDVTDPNALGPQSLTIVMKDGTEYSADCADPYGSPGNPMQRPEREKKVHRCFEVGDYGNDPEALIKTIEDIWEMTDIRTLFSTVCD